MDRDGARAWPGDTSATRPAEIRITKAVPLKGADFSVEKKKSKLSRRAAAFAIGLFPFAGRESSFAGSEWAFAYRKQLGRRNLTDEQKAYMIGKMYEARKKTQGGDHGNQYTKVANGQNVHLPTRRESRKPYGKSIKWGPKQTPIMQEATDILTKRIAGETIRLYDLEETAAFLGVSTRTVRNYVYGEIIPCCRLNRKMYFSEENLRRFLHGAKSIRRKESVPAPHFDDAYPPDPWEQESPPRAFY